MLKYSFSRFKNTASNPIDIDLEDSVEDVRLHDNSNDQDKPTINEAEDMVVDLISDEETPIQEAENLMDNHTTSDEV